MVDFKKRLAKKPAEKSLDPAEIYEKLDRASDKGPLRPVQEAVLKEWHQSYRDKKDVILKLNTGQGKTLIGLLMLQSKLNQGESPALYLCPNNFLVNQTYNEANQFGVNCVTTNDDLPDEFLDGKSILITSVQKLFNGLSKFGIGAHSLDVPTVLMDDAHTCIEAIRDASVIRLNHDDPAYSEIVNLFAQGLEEQGVGTYADIKRHEYSAFLPVPYWEWIDRHVEVAGILSKYTAENNIKFAWPLLKDNLKHCLCVISGPSLEIAPYLPPLHMFGTYHNARHRIFMSATVTDDSFMIKGLGLSEEAIKEPLIYKDEKWSGEKMVLIPALIHPALSRERMVEAFAKPTSGRRHGVVVLSPSFESCKDWEGYGSVIAKKEDIESKVKSLKDKNWEKTLVVVNRYDGIDLPDDSCRILIIDSKPHPATVIDRYVEGCRSSSEVIAIKTARTVE